jgi:hypothetical protein
MSEPFGVDGFAHVVMMPNIMSYNPGEMLFKVIEESDNYVIVETQIGQDKIAPTAIKKNDCEDVWKEGVQFVKMYGVVR